MATFRSDPPKGRTGAQCAAELRAAVDAAEPALSAMGDEASGDRPGPGRWSPRAVIGHLIDSASNNHRRFVLGQVQEICDRVGILHRGRLLCEGKLEDLISVENQTQLIVENASAELLARLEAEIAAGGARLVEKSKPQTTLERFFLEVTK